ncbi:MAG: sulfatase-like hydrolase/transferase [Bacteroidetes bacterium]|nr:sulfatase-like hydrolase/transferase [Bacteroidota bacterium]
MQKAGYYCTNNAKEDYNFDTPEGTWDAMSGRFAHYRNRKEGQPFFAVFNLTTTHESRIWGLEWEQLLTDPEKVHVPSYFPDDNKLVRRDISRSYSNISLVDHQISVFLDELDRKGLMDSTIIVVWSDHGGPLPRQKRVVFKNGSTYGRLMAINFAGDLDHLPPSIIEELIIFKREGNGNISNAAENVLINLDVL